MVLGRPSSLLVLPLVLLPALWLPPVLLPSTCALPCALLCTSDAAAAAATTSMLCVTRLLIKCLMFKSSCFIGCWVIDVLVILLLFSRLAEWLTWVSVWVVVDG